MADRRQDSGPSKPLFGRHSERATLDGLLDQALGRHSAVIVMRGEAGIGKTALLHYVTDRATSLGFTLARCVGVESEMELAFAGLHDLCAPIIDRLDSLVEPQRRALRVALGLASGNTPGPFLVALATLSLLSEASESQPVVCVVDDAHWLDQASAQILGFVGRRLSVEPVALVFAARTPVTSPDHLAVLPQLELAGLDEPSARALLASVATARLDESVRARIIEETRGNPLALLELGAILGAADFAGGFAMPDAESVPRRVQDQYLTRLRGLPNDAQRLVLLASADPVGDPELLHRAAQTLQLGVDTTDVAVDAGLLRVEAGVRFRHPLLRSAVYRTAAPEDRRAAHAALAAATDLEVDPDRRAWHRACAASGPDERIAA
ncbi:MAG: AAA family ATPase, partial [Mycolicibacterium sp.]|nr:AAA family ATPase [Mycolicibacterium sp.]